MAEWGRAVDDQLVRQAVGQIEKLIAQVESRTGRIVLPFLNTYAEGEVTGGKLLLFLRVFEAALRSFQ